MNNRNQPCKCGSGYKFKRCCGSTQAMAEAREAEKARQIEEYRAHVRRMEEAAEEQRKAEERRRWRFCPHPIYAPEDE